MCGRIKATMRAYDLVLLLKDSLSESERKKLLTTVKTWFKDAKIAKEDEWGQKMLAYPIKRHSSAYYHRMIIESEQGLGIDLEKRLLENESVLRHLLLRTK